MTQNGPQLPQMAQKLRPDLRTFSAFFLSEEAVPQTFSLLECMLICTMLYLRPACQAQGHN